MAKQEFMAPLEKISAAKHRKVFGLPGRSSPTVPDDRKTVGGCRQHSHSWFAVSELGDGRPLVKLSGYGYDHSIGQV